MTLLPGRCQKAFTLIELMIVVAIVGILAAVAVPAYVSHVLRVRQAGGVQRLLDIKSVQEKFYALNDVYCESNSNPQFLRMLSFDITDTKYYKTPVLADLDEATEFRASMNFDLNQDGAANDCWRITESDDAPTACAANNQEGFSLSIIGSIL